MDDHAKVVALRHKHSKKEDFYRILKHCFWSNEEIDKMWEYAQKHKDDKEEK